MSNTERLAVLPPALLALGAQVLAVAAALALAIAGSGLGLAPPLWLAIAGVGLLAHGISRWLRLPSWWCWINLAFIPLLALAWSAEIDPRWYLVGFVLLAVTSLGVVKTRVPLYLSSARAADELARLLPQGGRLLDLGCGLGGPLARVRAVRADARLAGVEAAPLNWLFSCLRLLGRAEIRLGSLWNADLSDADLVYAYLSPAPMPRLWQKARAEMRSGTLLVSNTFPIPGVEPDEVVELRDLSAARLLIWRMP